MNRSSRTYGQKGTLGRESGTAQIFGESMGK
jgi:hypothetical protein